MSGGGLLKYGFVRADKTSSREEIEALKIARIAQEAIELERMKVRTDESEEARLHSVVRGKKVSDNKEAVRKRRERSRNKRRQDTMRDESVATAQVTLNHDDDVVKIEAAAQFPSGTGDDDTWNLFTS
jgi:hypothetical protein